LKRDVSFDETNTTTKKNQYRKSESSLWKQKKEPLHGEHKNTEKHGHQPAHTMADQVGGACAEKRRWTQ